MFQQGACHSNDDMMLVISRARVTADGPEDQFPDSIAHWRRSVRSPRPDGCEMYRLERWWRLGLSSPIKKAVSSEATTLRLNET